MINREIIPPRSTSRWPLPVLTQALGYSGVLPFIGLAMAIGLQPQQQRWQQLLAGYALAILCFLLGAWWAIALLRRFRLPLLLSNLLVIATVFSFILLPTGYFYLIAATLFIVLTVVERRHPQFSRQPTYYALMRVRLSAIAAASLVAGFLFIANVNG
jgi:hypothetical protein